jgi:hypothetical protein
LQELLQGQAGQVRLGSQGGTSDSLSFNLKEIAGIGDLGRFYVILLTYSSCNKCSSYLHQSWKTGIKLAVKDPDTKAALQFSFHTWYS